jgi:hypothetical protein
MPRRISDRTRILKKYDNELERIFSSSLDKREAIREQHRKKIQRLKYKTGAAKSPTPPPRKSVTRDIRALKVLGLIEFEAIASGSVQVKALVEKYLYEQGIVEEDQLKNPAYLDRHLKRDLRAAFANGDLKQTRKLQARERVRLDFRKAPAPIYSWDKATSVLKSAFYSWSMPPDAARPFSLLLSRDVLANAKASNTSIVSHLSDRLRRLIKARGLSDVEYWFVLEKSSTVGLHLHGAISWPVGPAAQASLRDALLKLSGGSNSGQLKISRTGPKMGWASYCQKHHVLTNLALSGSSLTGSIGVLRRAKCFYEEFRLEYRRRLES